MSLCEFRCRGGEQRAGQPLPQAARPHYTTRHGLRHCSKLRVRNISQYYSIHCTTQYIMKRKLNIIIAIPFISYNFFYCNGFKKVLFRGLNIKLCKAQTYTLYIHRQWLIFFLLLYKHFPSQNNEWKYTLGYTSFWFINDNNLLACVKY